MESIQFGIGQAYMIPLTTGNPPSPAFPQRILTIADAEITFDRKQEKLMGQFQNPDDVADSDEDVKFKLSAGRVGIDVYNMMFGETAVTGADIPFGPTAPTAIPGTPFQITPALPGSGTFSEDWGVVNAANVNQQFQKVPSSPAAGQYSESGGVYTFSSADHTSAISVIISGSATVTTGRTLTRNNQLQGYGPNLELVIVAPYTSLASASPLGVFRLRACKFAKMGAPMKLNGYLITPLEGQAFPDASGKIWDLFS